MNRAIWVTAALVFAVPAMAADKTDDKPADAKKAATDKSKPKGAAAKDAKKAKPKVSTAEQKKLDAAAADRAAVQRAKSVFMFAVESCERPERCDQGLRDDAEQRFLDACRVCTTGEKCEDERAAIRDGKARRISNPCAP